jgi:type IV pilus assembly protein PilP
MANRDHTVRLLATTALLALLAGCAADKSDLEKFVRDERAKQGGAIEPLPTPRVFDTFTYKPGERRSPFKVDLTGTALARAGRGANAGGGDGSVHPDDERPREYLEDFALDALKMVGHLELKGTMYALVKDADGAVHRVKVGNYMGQNHGKIINLSETEIRISEIVSDGKGSFVSRDTSIALGQ